MRAAGVAPGLSGYRLAPRNAQWIELPDASAEDCEMKPTEAAVGIVATRSVAWLQNADLGWAELNGCEQCL